MDPEVTTFDTRVLESRRQVVRLGPLSLGALHEMLSLRLGQVFARPTLVKIAEVSGGNPLYALEIARELLRAGEPRAGSPLPVPDDLRQLVAARVRRLPSRAREALLVAAALSHPTIAHVDEAALQSAEEADIVRIAADGRTVFAHPLYVTAVYESTPAARRRALHRQLAELVQEEDERAHHLALATPAPDEDVARTLEQGAGRARARGAWQSAADLLEQARALTPPDQLGEAVRRGIAAAEHYTHAGDRRKASRLLEELLGQSTAGPLRAVALRLLGEIRYNDESFREAMRFLEEARQYATDARLIAEIELDLAYAASNALPNTQAMMHGQQALDLTTTLEDDGLQTQALAFRAITEYLAGRGFDWETVTKALALEDHQRLIPLQAAPAACQGCCFYSPVGWPRRVSN